MYYSYPCPYCRKLFYTYHSNKEHAAEVLYHGIKKHLTEYGEDHKEHTLDEGAHIEVNQMYAAVSESSDEPTGGYEL